MSETNVPEPDLELLERPLIPDVAHDLMSRGFARVPGRWQNCEQAWNYARTVFAEASLTDPLHDGMPDLQVVGEFTVPPPEVCQRPFQALHIDFGVPLAGEVPTDVARFTALLRDAREDGPGAITRLVPLRRLLAHRSWVDRQVIAQRLRQTVTLDRTVEGILGRIIDVARKGHQLVPLDAPGHLCGMEFDSLAHERSFFEESGLPLTHVEERVFLGPGEMLVIDNLRTAHGRAGLRSANQLHQLFVGYPSLHAENQQLLLARVLSVFDG